MTKAILYALLYTATSVSVYSLTRLLLDNPAYAVLAGLLYSVCFSVAWKPTFPRMVLSATLYSLAFSVDLHSRWYWLSHVKSEGDWEIYLAGISFVTPLLITWLTLKVWKVSALAFRRLNRSSD